MAQVTSLGVHRPTALSYMIKEGLLPPGPTSRDYQWQTYASDGSDVDDEILFTDETVVWSRGTFVQEVYRFGLDGEKVTNAVLTTFSNTDEAQTNDESETASVSKGYDAIRKAPKLSSNTRGHNGLPSSLTHSEVKRALVVILRSKAHVYFLQGRSNIVDLPFEVESSFPAPRGLLLQRKASTSLSAPLSPRIPKAPPNSFFSSQTPVPASFLQSPTLLKSFGNSQHLRPSINGVSGTLDALYNDIVVTPAGLNDEDVANIFSLTDPLSDLGVVSFAVPRQKPRLQARPLAEQNIDFEPLDPSERVIYVSSCDELDSSNRAKMLPMILLVTVNNDYQAITIWHAWYAEERSLAYLMKRRASVRDAKTKRRSSFMSTTAGTGATTPAARRRDGTRESFAAPGTLLRPGEQAGSQGAAPSARKPAKLDDEAAMASQMDPDYQPAASQLSTRESRRISSIPSDVRTSHTVGAGGHNNRRHTSFGGPGDRRSFGLRKSRASTPGSVFSRSIGQDEDSMDVDTEVDLEDQADLDATLSNIRAAIEAAGTDNLFGGSEEHTKRDLLVRRLHQLPLSVTEESASGSKPRVVVLSDQHDPVASLDRKLHVYVHERTNKQTICVKLAVKYRALWPELPRTALTPVPIVRSETNIGPCTDVEKLNDGTSSAILLGQQGIALSPNDDSYCPVPPEAVYRLHSTLALLEDPATADIEAGRNRTLPQPKDVVFGHPGSRGAFDEIAEDGTHHRRQLKFKPRDIEVRHVLTVCQFLLPAHYACAIQRIWCIAYAWLIQHPQTLLATAFDVEWVALVTTIFVPVISLLDEKARAAMNISKMASGKQNAFSSSHAQLHKLHQDGAICSKSSLGWMGPKRDSSPRSRSGSRASSSGRRDNLIAIAAALADELAPAGSVDEAVRTANVLMRGLHILLEEKKLQPNMTQSPLPQVVTPIVLQLGGWLGLRSWSLEATGHFRFAKHQFQQLAFVPSNRTTTHHMAIADEPLGVLEWAERIQRSRVAEAYPSLSSVIGKHTTELVSSNLTAAAAALAPRLAAVSAILWETRGLTCPPPLIVEALTRHGISHEMLEIFPETISAPLQEAVTLCERQPPTAWTSSLLRLVGREDLQPNHGDHFKAASRLPGSTNAARDMQAVCHGIELPSPTLKTKEAHRNAISQLIFSEDRRLVEATSLMHFNSVQVAECPKQPDWSDAQHFEMQRRLAQWVTIRMTALPAGDGMLHYDSQTPLLTDRYLIPGFSSTCMMQPMRHIMTTDRTGLTEEKVSWAFFHAGVSAGLRISRGVKGIDTSWVAFNKPIDLTNRHAGLLLALGLGGHLRSLAKWLSFKYLTPKHNMTSVGLLLGLSASYIGTSDSLITRMLSVHITRMLPPGAAELNVSPVTQTAGLMGIGLLYYNTQHRRMSEIMLSEIEFMEIEDPDSGPDQLRDESYRLAAGFAFGFINLGKGRSMAGLQGMYSLERLLAIAVGPRPVNAVHVFDRATAGAIVAIALVYMKSGDKAIARKVDVPDTETQFDHVRPDILLLRAMAKHVILWDSVSDPGSDGSLPMWIQANLPSCYKSKLQSIDLQHKGRRDSIKTTDVPFFNIITGLVWALGLKFAGSGHRGALAEIIHVLDRFYMLKEGGDYYYDAKLTRATIRRCIDVCAVSAAMVMAGTGDLTVFRYLRRLHGRVDADTPYGSHMASHLAIGLLFLAGGTYTLGTSDLAIASMICAFYPLYPTDVQDNRCHLQAFRHFWVLAAEPRCLVAEDVDTQRPVTIPIQVKMISGEVKRLKAPCLLPEFEQISSIQTDDPAYWSVILDFKGNPAHLKSFRQNPRVLVRRCPAAESHGSVFSSTLAALNDAQSTQSMDQTWLAVFALRALREVERAEVELILAPDAHSSIHTDERRTKVDDRLSLRRAAYSNDKDVLLNLRALFAWAERAREEHNASLLWISDEVFEALRATIEARTKAVKSSA